MKAPLSSIDRSPPSREPLRKGLCSLREQVEGSAGSGAGLRRWAVDLPALPVTAWLRAQVLRPAWYWQSRDGVLEMGGIGVADEIRGAVDAAPEAVLSEVSRRLVEADDHVRYVGGMRFDPRRTEEEAWAPFGGTRMYVPRLALSRREHRCTLALHALEHERDQALHWLKQEQEQLAQIAAPSTNGRPSPARRSDLPDRRHWRTMVGQALEAIDENHLEKIVLARRAGFSFEQQLDEMELLQCLLDVTPQCFKFCYSPEPGRAFLGASPERLYARVRRHVESEAIAGTRPRAAAVERDRRLAAELLSSEKDLREHYYVRDSLVDVLDPLCETLTCDAEVSLLKLARKQHLYSGLHGRLSEGVSDADLLGALHPTPAVGGYPDQPALERIRDWEGFDRGWYAAPVGWMSRDAAEWAVARTMSRSGTKSNIR